MERWMMRKSNILFRFSSKYWTSKFIPYLAHLSQAVLQRRTNLYGTWQHTKGSTNRLANGSSQLFEGKDFCQSSDTFVPLDLHVCMIG